MERTGRRVHRSEVKGEQRMISYTDVNKKKGALYKRQ